MAIAGHVSRRTLSRYAHIRTKLSVERLKQSPRRTRPLSPVLKTMGTKVGTMRKFGRIETRAEGCIPKKEKAPQVGLEPTTLRLTGKPKSCISLALRACWLCWSILLHDIRREIVQELFSRFPGHLIPSSCASPNAISLKEWSASLIGGWRLLNAGRLIVTDSNVRSRAVRDVPMASFARTYNENRNSYITRRFHAEPPSG